MRGAARGDLQAVEWLRRAAREAASGSSAVSVELLRRAESLLPGGHPDGDLVCVELVEALLRAGKTADGAARAEAVLARRHRPEADVPLRLSVISALSILNQPDKLIDRAEAALANQMGSKKWRSDCVVTACVPGNRFAFDVKAGPFKVAGWAYEFATTESGCLVTELWEDHRGALVTWISPVITGTKDRARRNQETMAVTLERLAAAAEKS